MFDGFWSGLLGGLFGATLVQWLRCFKYPVIFLGTVTSVFIGMFILGVINRGWEFAVTVGLKRAIEFDGILSIAAIGLIVVFIVFVCSIGISRRDSAKDQ